MSKPLFLVVWIDAVHPDGSWQDEHEAKCEVTEIVSVGFLIAHNEVGVTLASTRSKDGMYTQEMHIPLGCVVSIDQLDTRGEPLLPKARRTK